MAPAVSYDDDVNDSKKATTATSLAHQKALLISIEKLYPTWKGLLKFLGAMLASASLCYLIYSKTTPSNYVGVLLSIIPALVLADFTLGFLHWGLDNYTVLDGLTNAVFGSGFVVQYGKHHAHASFLVNYSFCATNSDGCLFTIYALSTVRFIYFASDLLYPSTAPWTTMQMFKLSFWTFFYSLGALANNFHKWSHMEKPPAFVRFLQKIGLCVSYDMHRGHHHNTHTNYCLMFGCCNPLLDAIGLWPALDNLVLRIGGQDKFKLWRDESIREKFIDSVTGVKSPSTSSKTR